MPSGSCHRRRVVRDGARGLFQEDRRCGETIRPPGTGQPAAPGSNGVGGASKVATVDPTKVIARADLQAAENPEDTVEVAMVSLTAAATITTFNWS